MHKLIENQVRISVRNLVEFILRSGDIDNRHSTKAQYDAMQIGSRLHRKIQGSMPGTYKAEVSLKHTEHYRDVEILLEGRADGIITPDEKSVRKNKLIYFIRHKQMGMYQQRFYLSLMKLRSSGRIWKS